MKARPHDGDSHREIARAAILEILALAAMTHRANRHLVRGAAIFVLIAWHVQSSNV